MVDLRRSLVESTKQRAFTRRCLLNFLRYVIVYLYRQPTSAFKKKGQSPQPSCGDTSPRDVARLNEIERRSYGFRPNTSAHHAVARCRYTALTGFTWIIEGDVKACFDEISHKAILRCLREKVIDKKFLALIQLLLKAGAWKSTASFIRPPNGFLRVASSHRSWPISC